jgi:hypothetical protein
VNFSARLWIAQSHALSRGVPRRPKDHQRLWPNDAVRFTLPRFAANVTEYLPKKEGGDRCSSFIPEKARYQKEIWN